jgi:tartrate/fumarate subfamily iron-sulfur-dependent hydro-lyase beta chain
MAAPVGARPPSAPTTFADLTPDAQRHVLRRLPLADVLACACVCRTLRALGLSARGLIGLVLMELLVLALVSGAIGIGLGYLVAAALFVRSLASGFTFDDRVAVQLGGYSVLASDSSYGDILTGYGVELGTNGKYRMTERIDLRRPMSDIRETLSKFPVKTRLSLTGPMVVARDIAHAKLKERLDAGEGLPAYLKDHMVYYAGPAKTPQGLASGSFGPTTAGRMDSYVDAFQAAGGSLVMLAKGNRSKQVTDACRKHGGFYLGSIGGPAARLAQDNITKVEVLDFVELGMEAVWKIEVVDFPAFIVVDDKGNDFFAETMKPVLSIGMGAPKQ